MGFKKKNWVKYGRIGRTARLEVRDEDDKVLDRTRWSLADKYAERRIFNQFKKDWGVFKRIDKEKLD